MGELVVQQPTSLVEDVRELGAELRLNGLILRDDITPEQFEALAFYLTTVRESMMWAMGDLQFQGEKIFGHAVYQLIEIMKLSEGQRLQHFRVSGDVPLERRRLELSWSHHRAIAPLEPEQQVEWLQKAAENRWTKLELEEHLREWRGVPKKPHRPYVVEQVCDAAEHIWDEAVQSEDGYVWTVPNAAMEGLADALGVVE